MQIFVYRSVGILSVGADAHIGPYLPPRLKRADVGIGPYAMYDKSQFAVFYSCKNKKPGKIPRKCTKKY